MFSLSQKRSVLLWVLPSPDFTKYLCVLFNNFCKMPLRAWLRSRCSKIEMNYEAGII